MRAGTAQSLGAGSTTNARRKCAALAAAHLLLDDDDCDMCSDVLLERKMSRMAMPNSSRSKTPVSMLAVKKIVTGPGISGASFSSS